MPDVKNFALNKYGLPTYGQLNVDFRYYFKGALSGLESIVCVQEKYWGYV